jgi:hypothetical protein
MEDFLNREDALELIIYYGAGAWLIIALLMAYFKTKKEFESLKLLKFFGYIFQYTIGFAFVLLEVFTGNKNGGGGSSGGSTERTITKVQCRGGFANVTYSTGKNKAPMSFTVAAKEVVGWTGQSVTVKVLVNSKYIVNTYDIFAKQTDTYFE